MDIKNLSALELGAEIKKKNISVKEAVLYSIEQAEKNKNNAFITICKNEALLRAEKVQKAIDDGTLNSPLAGVPMAVKDNICIKNVRTTCGSKMLENYVPVYNAAAYERLEKCGAVLIGKTNMDEFAMGSTGETSCFGGVKNPINELRTAGGSSSGSAAAVCAKDVFFALGTDTGGSVRQPAAFCGLVGIKPTYGAVSRYGLIAYASSLDQIAPIGKNVKDVAAVVSAMSGYDKKDCTSFLKENFSFNIKAEIKHRKIGMPKECFGKGLNDEIKEKVISAAKALEKEGAIIEEFSMPELKYAVPTYYIIACAEASSNLARYDGVRFGHRTDEFNNLEDLYTKSRSEGFGKEVKRRILIGTFVLSSGYYEAYYKKALKAKNVIKKAFDNAFMKYDAILTPTTPSTAPKFSESLNDPLKMYMSDIYTVPANLAGLPAISVPCGKDKDGMPIGLQLIGKAFDDEKILDIAYSYERAGGL